MRGVSMLDKIRNELITCVATIVDKMKANRFRCLGHVMKKDDSKVVRVRLIK